MRVACCAWLFSCCLAQPRRVVRRSSSFSHSQPRASSIVYRPDNGDRPDVRVLLIRRVNNYLGHIAGPEIGQARVRRSHDELALRQQQTSVISEEIALDVKTAVEFMRKQIGVRRVVPVGQSGRPPGGTQPGGRCR